MKSSKFRPFSLTRRGFMSGAAAAGVTLAAPNILSAKSNRIVYANWGGSWEQAMRKAWWTPFTEETGIDIVSASNNTMGRLQAMVDSGRVEWDLMEGVPELSSVGEQLGLLEKIDPQIVDRSGIMPRPEFMSDYSIPQVLFGRILTYNTNLPEAPSRWEDLWDLERFPGKRALYNRVESGNLEVALLADGVPPDELYPLDVPRALNKLSEIKDHIIWFETVTQSEQIMRDGQATVGLLADGRALNVKNSGAPVEVVPEATVLTWSVFVIPKGAPNPEGAMKFLSYVLEEQAQVAIAMAYTYGPVVPSAWDQLPPERAMINSGGPNAAETAVFQSSEWWSKNMESAAEQFQQWMLS